MNIQKHFAKVVTAIAAVAVLSSTGVADAYGPVEVTVNGSAVDLAHAPIIQDGRVFVPLRGVFEQLGASVVYSDRTITATGNGRNIELQIGSTQATVDDQPQVIDVAPFIVGASTYVPLRFISEALGDSVNWDESDDTAAIATSGGSADYYSPGTASYVDTAPPPIPVYQQPPVPEPNEIWQPGYWAWGAYGYYWVPGTWVVAPQSGYVWTPGYWQALNGGYNWSPGYWATAVGFYGGVNYGCGYFGNGYDGGRWSHDVYQYNTYVTRVNVTIVRNVYVDRTVYVNDTTTTRIGYNGGARGLHVLPTERQVAIAKAHHIGMTQAQLQHIKAAEGDRRLLATVNEAAPPIAAVARPLAIAARPAGFVPVKPADRVKSQANVAPVRVEKAAPVYAAAPAPIVRQRPAAPTVHEAPPAPIVREAAHPAIVHEAMPAPAAPAAPVVRTAPVVHADPEVAAPRPRVFAAPPPRTPVTRVAPRSPAAVAAPPRAPRTVHGGPRIHPAAPKPPDEKKPPA